MGFREIMAEVFKEYNGVKDDDAAAEAKDKDDKPPHVFLAFMLLSSPADPPDPAFHHEIAQGFFKTTDAKNKEKLKKNRKENSQKVSINCNKIISMIF